MNEITERIQYLTKKAQLGAITQSEQDELAELLGYDPQEFSGSDGLSILLGIALVAIAIALIVLLVTER